MRTARLTVVGLTIVAALTACGSSKPVAGHDQAAAACKTGGSQAAALASQAAALNPTYATLSADETALAASESTEQGELSDGDNSDDSGLGALAGADSIGTGSDISVITDCVKLGLPVTH